MEAGNCADKIRLELSRQRWFVQNSTTHEAFVDEKPVLNESKKGIEIVIVLHDNLLNTIDNLSRSLQICLKKMRDEIGDEQKDFERMIEEKQRLDDEIRFLKSCQKSSEEDIKYRADAFKRKDSTYKSKLPVECSRKLSKTGGTESIVALGLITTPTRIFMSGVYRLVAYGWGSPGK